MTNELASYYRALERNLQCPKAKREELVGEAQRLIDDFMEGNPNAAFSDVLQFAGSPEELAQSYHETLGPEVTKRYRRSKRIKLLLVFGVVAIALIAAMLYNAYLQNRQYEVDITGEMTTIIYETGKVE